MAENIIEKLLQVINATPLDTRAGYLIDKLIAGSNVTINTIDPDGNGNLSLILIVLENLTQNISNAYGDELNPNFIWGDGAMGGISGTVQFTEDNIAIGKNALNVATRLEKNIGIGFEALKNLGAFAEGNTAIGYQAGNDNTAASLYNTLIGYRASDGPDSMGDNNVIVGARAMNISAFTGSQCIFIGADSGLTASGSHNDVIVIGYDIQPSIPTTGGWCIAALGKPQYIFEGANAAMGQSTLVAGAVVVPNTLVTANSRIFLTNNNPGGGGVGSPYIAARVPGVSFTINSTNGADTSDVAWEIKEPT